MSSYFGKPFDIIRALPRVGLRNLKPNPGAYKKNNKIRGSKTLGLGFKRKNPNPAGFEGGSNPFYKRFPDQNWSNEKYSKLSYQKLNMHELQLYIDLGRIRTDIPIDITQIYNIGKFKLDPEEREAGFLLDDEGIDFFGTKLNLEVQFVENESVIAAVERAGGVITTAYYDPVSIYAATRPFEFFKKGVPIPRRTLPPRKLIEYYTDPKNRGYLSDPDLIAKERLLLAQKYGYELPDIANDPDKDVLLSTKDPRQIFHGLQPGWVVNLHDQVVMKPLSPELKEFYAS